MNKSVKHPWDEAKEKLFKIVNQIEEIKSKPFISESDELLLRNLEIQKWQAYSDWKDPYEDDLYPGHETWND